MSLLVKDLRKSFGGKIAVDNLCFEMNRPGVFGLIGTNGAGKTTTIRCILGIMTPDSGARPGTARPSAAKRCASDICPRNAASI